MKLKFSTIDIIATLQELQKFLGMRVINVYDTDHKTYLFKLNRQDEKGFLLLESGSRIHATEYEWMKNPAPSGFSMKLRKHILNRRLEKICQLGIDRIVDMQFGSNEAAYHVILELYDKGNIVLTDHEYTILNILRPRTENKDVKFLVREKYPVDNAKQHSAITLDKLQGIFANCKPNDNMRRILNPHLPFGPAVLDHLLISAGFKDTCKEFNFERDGEKLLGALRTGEDQFINESSRPEFKGYIVQKREKRAKQSQSDANQEDLLVYSEYHPFLFKQHMNGPYLEFPSFNKAVDDFYSKLESQKLELKVVQQERDALKKLDNVKKDHQVRIENLQKAQDEDCRKAQLIEMNLDLVEKAITVLRSLVANQLPWDEIWEIIREAQAQGDPVAKCIKTLRLEINHFTMMLSDPYGVSSDDEDEENVKGKEKVITVEIDLDLTSYANAKKYYDMKRHASKKELKTVESSTKAYKSAEKKTKQQLKEVQLVSSINKARKLHWFEKFFWFVSSENYLVIGGRDQQQNEIIVKRYLKTNDVYVHADLHGASSIVIKNHSGNPIPPKTLNEAGVMAVCYSVAWDAKVVTSAWWVHSHQVSKTAPTGEYLSTGSFMIRGKKNYLPPCHLIMGFGFLFRLDDESLVNHQGERKVMITEEEADKQSLETQQSTDTSETVDEEIVLSDSPEDSDKEENEDETLDTENQNDETELGKKEDSDPKSEDSEEESSKDESSKEPQVEYPDTVVQLQHIGGGKFEARPVRENMGNKQTSVVKEIPTAIKEKATQGKKKGTQKQEKKDSEEIAETARQNSESSSTSAQLVKRGQKFKLKKMKKYKDQDEEDRLLAMKILQSAGSAKETKSKKNKKEEKKGKNMNKGKPKQPQGGLQGLIYTEEDMIGSAEGPSSVQEEGNKPEDVDSEDEKESGVTQEDMIILNSLTGIPIPDDVLLYSIPVCAPYNAIVNYKYKIKLTPGTGKKGKACKTALNMFGQDKGATKREKDLLRSVKDQDISRNIPGKVKLSAPQLTKIKHK